MRAPLLTPAEAARELRVSEKQLRWLTNAGQIRYINVGLGEKRECRRYDPSDLDQFREARACQSTGGKVAQLTAMISNSKVHDIREIRKNLRSAGRNNSSQTSRNP